MSICDVISMIDYATGILLGLSIGAHLQWIVPTLASGSSAVITPSSGRLPRVDSVCFTGPLRTPSFSSKMSVFDFLIG